MAQEQLITSFLGFFGPLILDSVESIFAENNISFKKNYNGIRTTYKLGSNDHEIIFFTENMFLEIATTDRDNNQPRFDTDLYDHEYLLAKIVDVINGKMRMLLPVLNGEDIHKVANKLGKEKCYSRISVLEIDKDDQEK